MDKKELEKATDELMDSIIDGLDKRIEALTIAKDYDLATKLTILLGEKHIMEVTNKLDHENFAMSLLLLPIIFEAIKDLDTKNSNDISVETLEEIFNREYKKGK